MSQLIIKWQMNMQNLGCCHTMVEKFVFAFKMLFNVYILLSIFFTLLSGLSWMIAMSRFDISYAYPFTSLGFVLILFFSVILFHEEINIYTITGTLFIVIGIFIVSKSQ